MIASRIPGLAASTHRALALLAGLCLAMLLALGARALLAQIEGDRGIAPLVSTGDFEVSAINVDVHGKNADDARANGFKEAARQAFARLVKQSGGTGTLPDDAIGGLIAAIEVQQESIGPRRYIATLTVVFDRARTGERLGLVAGRAHSAPMLIIPVMEAGGAASVFETRTAWQRAWAEFRTSESVIDYVRPNGAGADSLLLTAGQVDRRSRTWWRMLLTTYDASGVLMPVARIQREWPGGPVRGTFTARYGPDNKFLGSVELTAKDEAGIPAMMVDGVRQLDSIYAGALNQGLLAPDTSLNLGSAIDPALIDAVLDRAGLTAGAARMQVRAAQGPDTGTDSAAADPAAAPSAVPVATFTVQVATADAAAVDDGVGAVRGAPGVKSAATTSLAIGGTSVMRVSFAGTIDQLAEALRARGFRVTVGAGALSIRR